MQDEPALSVTNFLTPYDVCILILIYFYCFEGQRIPAKILVNLISSTISTPDVNPILEKDFQVSTVGKPLLPILEQIVAYLVDSDQYELAVKLVSFLRSMTSLDMVIELIKTLEADCLTIDYRHMRKGLKERKIRRVTKESFIGSYMSKCFIKCRVGEFGEREALWNCLKKFISNFEQTPAWNTLQSHVHNIHFRFMPPTDEGEHDEEMNCFFQTLCEKNQPYGSHNMMVGSTHLQALLNWEIMIMSQSKAGPSQEFQEILDLLTLNDITHFPAVHVFRYLKAISNDCYQSAVDSLHNYFDYMLTQNDENCFHISLLCLATFHARLHDCNAAVKAFEEATKVARENKDTETLNLIMIWIVDFIESNPEYSHHFQVTVDQIVKYLKSCPDNESSVVFEHAYKFESLLMMMEDSTATTVLESTYKYLVIALQRLELGSAAGSPFKYVSRVWDGLGLTLISDVYKAVLQPSDREFDEIQKAFDSLERREFDHVAHAIYKLKSPKIVYEQRMQLMLLDIKYDIALEDYSKAMKKIYQLSESSGAKIVDHRWKHKFELLKCQIHLKCGVAMRSVTGLLDILVRSVSVQNPLRFSECLILLCEILKEAGNLSKCRSLLASNLPSLLQFPSLKKRVMGIMEAVQI